MIETLPRLSSFGQELDTAPEAFGWLRDSSEIVDDVEELRVRMADDGYIFLPGYLNREEVIEARRTCVQKLADAGQLDKNFDSMEAVAAPQSQVKFMPGLAQDNPALMKVLYDGPMMAFYEKLLGGPVRHFDFTWFRAVSPGRATPPHMDVVYMGRGTQKLFTSWTPLGDIDLETGGLIVLEKSHQHERLNKNYGAKDVDKFCTNRRGEGFTKMGGGGNISDGGWLSRTPDTLRKNLGGRWMTAPQFRMGDLLAFSVFTVHASLDNYSNRIRLSSDSRYQLASEPADERWIGPNPIGHGPAGKRGMIC
ncbi:MAG TPA: phytanoyl-CoA dioxygenase family protein [Abditibacteriaceae bacterium]|jgi:hypothetical protein